MVEFSLNSSLKRLLPEKNPNLLNIFVHSVGGKFVVSILLSVSVSLAG